ncbi:MAG TPA: hypothetical protein VH592_26695 [Gemmataceae bacterium]|jgi:hypothetical protein
MATTHEIDWTDVEAAGKALAGNWRGFDCFAWHRGYDLEDADRWMVWYTSSRDAGLLEQSNDKVFNDRLRPLSEGDDADVVFERHSHWAVGYLDGFSIRVFKGDGTITPAFEEFCRIKEALEDYPILNEQDYSEREYLETLANYRSEMWREKNLPESWESEVYSWFSDNHLDEYIVNRDDQGGWAPREKIVEGLQALGLMPTVVVEK